MCHGADAKAIGPVAQKNSPPTPDLTVQAFQKKLKEQPDAIISSIVLAPNKALILNTLHQNGIMLPPKKWTSEELQAINQYVLTIIKLSPRSHCSG